MGKPNKAFILAAGFGKRLRPHTEDKPKPMVTVAGTTLIDHTIDHLKDIGINDFIVNTHYKSEVLHSHLNARKDANFIISHEHEILDTGGGIKNALSHFGGEDFFVLSGDGLWSNGSSGSILKQMSDQWNPKKMDIILLLQPVSTMTTTKGVGDYNLDENNLPKRSKDQSGKYMFTSIRINRAAIFDETPDEPFSYLQLMDKAEQEGRLHAVIHDGLWHHISTPEDLEAVRALYDAQEDSREQTSS